MAAISNSPSDAFGKLYNVGTGINYSINQIAKIFDHQTLNIPARPGEGRITLANNKKISEIFGWEPTMKLEDWISSQIKNG